MNRSLIIMSEKLGQVKEWASQIPAFTRFVLVASLPLSILALFPLSLYWWFLNVPYYTLQGFQIWRLLTTDFVLPGVFDMLTGLFFFAYTAEKAEWRLGTVRYIFYFLVNTLIIQVAYCILMYILSILPIIRYFLTCPSIGLWSLVMVEVYTIYMKDMDAQVKPFGLIEVKSLFVFVGISAIGFIAVWGWFWPLVLGAGVGFLRVTGKLDKADLTKEKAALYEDKTYLLWLKKIGHFVLGSEVKTALADVPSSSAVQAPSI